MITLKSANGFSSTHSGENVDRNCNHRLSQKAGILVANLGMRCIQMLETIASMRMNARDRIRGCFAEFTSIGVHGADLLGFGAKQ